jgi:hypothetical protein
MGNKEEIENVERLEMMEEKCGVSIDGVYAVFWEYDDGYDERYLCITGEIQAVSGTTIDKNIDVVFTAYNAEGKVIATGGNCFDADDFFCLSPFEFQINVIEKPAKIKIYPKIS